MRDENSGGDVNYYRVEVKHPKRSEPYVAECEDVIAALGMDFFEGEAFKAIWRKAAQRTLGVGKAGNSALRDAQKIAHYGARCLALIEARIAANQPTVDAFVEDTLISRVEQMLGRRVEQACPLPWMPYTGGPVPDLEYVEVMTACGEPNKGPPSAFIWGGHGTKGRITHYRPAVKP